MKVNSLAVLLILLVLGLSIIINSLTFPYAINTWLMFFNKQPQVLWYHGAILGVVPIIGQLGIIIAALTWIAMLFL
jgi:hypothetical protein